MKTLQEYGTKQSHDKLVADFVLKLFEARQTIHVFHLRSKSFSEHKALDNYYSSLLDLIDEFVETYQGQYGLLDLSQNLKIEESDVLSCLKGVTEISEKTRKSVDPHLQNIVDTIVALTFRTIYKLENLK